MPNPAADLLDMWLHPTVRPAEPLSPGEPADLEESCAPGTRALDL
ncbi:hypothetical protein [Streptomyces mirabilis]